MNYFSRLSEWLNERFPPINFISGFFLYFLAKAIIAIDQSILSLSILDVCGMLLPTCHLFLLRVFDEFKDFESDARYYPQRVIQRGVFTLKDVGILGMIAFVIQIGCYLTIRTGVISDIFFAVLWIWTGLMVKEFFCGLWLKRNLFLYGLLHLLVTPILLLSLMTLIIGDFSHVVDRKNIILPLVISILTSWLYELSRKTKGRDEESGDLTYSTIWGVNKSLGILFASTIVTLFLSNVLFNSLGISNFYLAVLGVVLAVFSHLATSGFKKNATAKSRKKNEGVTLLVSLYAFLPPIIFAVLMDR